MALIVEDGTIVTGAESYATVAFADAYFASRGVAAWAAIASTELKEIALRKATDYMTAVYRDMWAGSRVNEVQELDWPRENVYRDRYVLVLNTVVPVEVQRACCEFALRTTTGDLITDQVASVLREKVGPIEVEYAGGQSTQVSFAYVNNMLAPYLNGGGANQRRLVRV